MRANDLTSSAHDMTAPGVMGEGRIGIGHSHHQPSNIPVRPSYVVTITDAGDFPVQHVIETVTKILANRVYDLVVRIELPMCEDDRMARLRNALGGDPRVRIAPPHSALGEFPDATFHVILPASVKVSQDFVHSLHTGFGDAVIAESFLPNGTKILIARGWALLRVHRSEAGAACFGKVRRIPASTLKLEAVDQAGNAIRITSAQAAHRPGTWPQLLDGVRNIRNAGEVWAFLKWTVSLIRWGVANKRLRVMSHLRRLLWAFFSCGASRPRSTCEGPNRTDGGTRLAIPRAASRENANVFDPGLWNPIGWVPPVGNEVAALGPLDLLPPGVEAHRVTSRDDVLRLRRAHHVEDIQAFHANVVSRARDLTRLAAAGVVVHLVDDHQESSSTEKPEMFTHRENGPSTVGASDSPLTGNRLRALVGTDLYRLMAADVSDIDVRARELLSVRMRRTAHREHLLRSGWIPPPVSILLATRRPRFLSWILDAVTRQTYPNLELVLALHGGPFGDVGSDITKLQHPVKIVQVPAREPLGAVLNAAVAAASGTLLAKMDDDDLYGDDHIWDLVLAHKYSGALLVGKWSEFVYLAASDQTIHRSRGCNEDYQGNLTGGTMLVSRSGLDRVGGWKRTPWGVDSALIGEFVQARQRIYRTHGLGYMVVRHGNRHTYNVSDPQFLVESDGIWRGWRPEIAGIEEPTFPYPRLDIT